MPNMIRVRLLYQNESARTYARAIAPTSVLANRNFPVFAQQQEVLNTSTNYSLTMLVDWRPTDTKIPANYGRTIWDVPEDIEDHMADPVYQAWFRQISCVSVPNRHLYDVVRSVAHQVVILPTYIPTAALLHSYQRRPQNAIGIFGRVDLRDTLPALLPWINKHKVAVLTDSHEIGKQFPDSAVFQHSFAAYQKTLGYVQCVLLPTSTRRLGDGFWARDASMLGIPVITTKWYPSETNIPLIAHSPEEIVELLGAERKINYQDMSQDKRKLGMDWGVQYQVERVWWKAWEKLAY